MVTVSFWALHKRDVTHRLGVYSTRSYSP